MKKYKNHVLLKLMQSEGLESPDDLYNRCGISPNTIRKILHLTFNGLTVYNEPKPTIVKLGEFFGVSPREVFPDGHLDTLETPLSTEEQQFLQSVYAPDDQFHDVEVSENKTYTQKRLASLPERVADVIRREFYDNQSVPSIASDLGLTRARIGQLRNTALRQLLSKSKTFLKNLPIYQAHASYLEREAWEAKQALEAKAEEERIQRETKPAPRRRRKYKYATYLN